MNREKLISREYKLVLKAENFTGDETALKEKAHTFWTNCKAVTEPVANLIHAGHNEITTQRQIRFYDTRNSALHNKDYIFRERKNLLEDEREVTLKFRHPDRYVSQDREMLARKLCETKFEEDIKAPFLKLYSFSSSQPVDNEQIFKTLKQVIKLYAGLASQLTKHADEEKISLVGNLTIRELVITGPVIVINDAPEVNAECALIAWYDMKTFPSDPIIVEFSFRYGNKKERYDRATAQKAYDVFILIQQEMKEWIDDKNATKTGFVYEDK